MGHVMTTDADGRLLDHLVFATAALKALKPYSQRLPKISLETALEARQSVQDAVLLLVHLEERLIKRIDDGS